MDHWNWQFIVSVKQNCWHMFVHHGRSRTPGNRIGLNVSFLCRGHGQSLLPWLAMTGIHQLHLWLALLRDLSTLSMGSLLRPVIMFLLGNLESKYFQSVAYVLFPMMRLVTRYVLKVFADRYSQGGRRDKKKMTGRCFPLWWRAEGFRIRIRKWFGGSETTEVKTTVFFFYGFSTRVHMDREK